MRKLYIIFVLTLVGAGVGLFIYPKSYFNFSDFYDQKYGNASYRFYYYWRNFIDPSFGWQPAPPLSKYPIDVLIPLVEKDLPTAQETVSSIRTMIFHPIESIYIVAPESKKIREFCLKNKLTFVREDEVIPNYATVKKKGGWILQQFIKLNADCISTAEHILVVDGDTVFLRPQIFVDNSNKYLINIHYDCHSPRKKFTCELLNQSTYYRYDFVAHHMLFSRKILKTLKENLQKIHGLSWEKSILKLMDKTKKDHDFSEYDLYTTYLVTNTCENFKIVASANGLLFRSKFSSFSDLKNIYASNFKTLISHHFINA